jgi:hypothetical protein
MPKLLTMARQYGQAGRSTRQMESKHGLIREGIRFVIIVVGIAFLLLLPHVSKVGADQSVEPESSMPSG